MAIGVVDLFEVINIEKGYHGRGLHPLELDEAILDHHQPVSSVSDPCQGILIGLLFENMFALFVSSLLEIHQKQGVNNKKTKY